MPVNGLPPFGINDYSLAFGTGYGLIAGDPSSSSIALVATSTGFSVAGTFATSGVQSFANGTAAAPSIAFTNSLTTGFYRSAADTIGIAVAGALDFSVSANSLNVLTGSAVYLADSCTLNVGTGNDLIVTHNGTSSSITSATGNLTIDNTAVTGATFIDLGTDTSATKAAIRNNGGAEVLTVQGNQVVVAKGLRTAAATAAPAITGATVLTNADSGGVFSVSQAAAYDIDLPVPTGAGERYTFYLTGAGANNVTITVTGSGATFVGTIVNDVTSVIPATGSTLTFATGAAALGDTIEAISISGTLYLIRAVTSAAGGITIA